MDAVVLLTIIGSTAVFMVLIFGGMLVMYKKLYRRVPPGHALVVTSTRGVLVARNGGMLVYPILNQAELIDLTVRGLVFERKGLFTKDDKRVDVTATVRIKVRDTTEDIEKVARSVGCARAADETVLRDLIGGRFGSALATVVRLHYWDVVLQKRDEVADTVTQLIEGSMEGYAIDDIAIDRIEPAE